MRCACSGNDATAGFTNTIIVNTIGETVANDDTDLFDGTLSNGIGYTEQGAALAASERVWTGSTSSGVAATDHCVDFTSVSNGDNSQIGDPSQTSSSWMSSGTGACDQSYHII